VIGKSTRRHWAAADTFHGEETAIADSGASRPPIPG
jgi:hypothetical protein